MDALNLEAPARLHFGVPRLKLAQHERIAQQVRYNPPCQRLKCCFWLFQPGQVNGLLQVNILRRILCKQLPCQCGFTGLAWTGEYR